MRAFCEMHPPSRAHAAVSRRPSRLPDAHTAATAASRGKKVCAGERKDRKKILAALFVCVSRLKARGWETRTLCALLPCRFCGSRNAPGSEYQTCLRVSRWREFLFPLIFISVDLLC